MLTRIAAAIVVLAASPAAAQDPELERDEATEQERVDEAEDADAQDAAKAEEGPVEIERRWQPRVAARVRAGAGAISGGDTINPGTGAMSVAEGYLRPRVRRWPLELALPVDYRYRQTFGTPLTEMTGRGNARLAYRLAPELRVGVELGLGATWKPDWHDPFQPLETGELGTTDRYSHWDRRAAVEAVVRTGAQQRVRVGYEYLLSVYQRDPMFDAIYDPIHLAPWDRERHRVDLSWRKRFDTWRLRVGVKGTRWQYFFMFAGDAKTGVTHAGPGGEPPNPLLELRALEPRVEVDYEVGDHAVLTARYELELVQDPFEGYLSYVGHHPELGVRWFLPAGTEVRARGELFVRRYGANSYAYEMDPLHPPLSWGDRRAERLGYATLTARKGLAEHWAAVCEAKLAVRSTNYEYSIDWNYLNYLAWAGAEYAY